MPKFSFPLLMIFLGLGLMSYWLFHNYLYFRSLSLTKAQAETLISREVRQRPLPEHIFIQWNTDADIEPLEMVDGEWMISGNKVTYLVGSALPGESGNIIMYGHNRREILGNIRALKGGEKITITTTDGVEHIYTVTRVAQVEPTQMDWLKPVTEETLTMYTCAGFWDSQRFLVQAKPLPNASQNR